MKPFSLTLNGRTLRGRQSKVADSTSSLVMITGMQEHSNRYKDLAKYLNSYNIDVYVFDHIGQGENVLEEKDKQVWPNDAFYFVTDILREQIHKIKSTKKHPVYLMGHSCGSFVCQMYLERYPNTADKVILMGSGKPGSTLTLKTAYLLSCLCTNHWTRNKPSKFMSSLALGPYSKAIKGDKDPLCWLSKNKDNIQAYKDDPQCGITNTNGFWKGFFKGVKTLYQKKNLKRLSSKERVLLISGAEDPVGGMSKGITKLYNIYKKYGIEDVTLKLYPTLRHELLNEVEYEEIYKDIRDFLIQI